MKRTGNAQWTGSLQHGRGVLWTQSGALSKVPYSFSTRFAGEVGTNPEELIAAAHAGCYSMAFTFLLEKHGLAATQLATKATLTVVSEGVGWTVTQIALEVTAQVPGASDDTVRAIAESAKDGCLVSRLIRAPVSLQLTL